MEQGSQRDWMSEFTERAAQQRSRFRRIRYEE